jgi:SulP family sulfate permease
MVISSLIFMRKASEMVERTTSLTKVGKDDIEIAWDDEKELDLSKWNHVYIKRLDGPVFFGVASKIMERINKIPEDAKVVIFRMKRVPYMDLSGLYAIQDVVIEMQKMGVAVVFTMTQSQPMYLFKRNKFVPEIVPEDYFFDSIEDCANWLKTFKKS